MARLRGVSPVAAVSAHGEGGSVKLLDLVPGQRFSVNGKTGTMLYVNQSRARVLMEPPLTDGAVRFTAGDERKDVVFATTYYDNLAPGAEVELLDGGRITKGNTRLDVKRKKSMRQGGIEPPTHGLEGR